MTTLETIKRQRSVRLVMAMLVVSGTALALSQVHDYQSTRYQINLIRMNDPIAAERPWIVVDRFFNEAGSGIKYLITGNEKHMRHFPTEEYTINKMTQLARMGDWRAQVRLSRFYYVGGHTLERNIYISLRWMQHAQLIAPLYAQQEIAEIIKDLEEEIIRTHI